MREQFENSGEKDHGIFVTSEGALIPWEEGESKPEGTMVKPSAMFDLDVIEKKLREMNLEADKEDGNIAKEKDHGIFVTSEGALIPWEEGESKPEGTMVKPSAMFDLDVIEKKLREEGR